MATLAAQTHLTPEEYITFERKAIPDAETVRSEYVKGKIIPRSSSNRAHNLTTCANCFCMLLDEKTH